MIASFVVVGGIFLAAFLLFCALYGCLVMSGQVSQDEEDAGVARRS